MPPDPEVTDRPVRRQFSAEYKLRILRQSAADETGLIEVRTYADRLKTLTDERNRLEAQIRDIEEANRRKQALFLNRRRLRSPGAACRRAAKVACR